MIGKKNVVFGFLFLVFTAGLGPVMVNMYEEWGAANAEKQQVVGRLQALASTDFEEDPDTLDELDAKALAVVNAEAILAMNKVGALEFGIDYIKGGPHAHGNLEALLNIAAGLTLGFLAVGTLFKQVISWCFILGTLFHSGLLYLERVFQLDWAGSLLATGIGPVLILVGLLLTGIAAFKGLQPRPVEDG